MDQRAAISAAVLAGGESRRMGSDKALLKIAGRPLLARTIDLLHRVSDDVLVIGRRAGYESFGAAVIADRFPSAGPLGGIATALSAATHEYVLVVACDMPLLSEPLLIAMAEEPRGYDVLVPAVIAGTDREAAWQWQPLHAIYNRGCLSVVEHHLRSGDRRADAFYGDVRVRQLDEAWVSQYDPTLASFTNANEPEELENVRRQLVLRGDGMGEGHGSR